VGLRNGAEDRKAGRGATVAPDPEHFLLVGKIVKPHGIKGELKVLPYSGEPADFGLFPTVFLVPGGELEVVSARLQGNAALLCLRGVEDRSGAEQLSGRELWTRREYFPALASDEFYWHEMVGSQVFTETGRELGTVTGLLSTGAHDVLAVRSRLGVEYLIPARREFLVETDARAGRVVIAPPPGLLEVYE